MPGKKKEKKKKSKDGTGSPTHIAAALMPTATITAVPRSPPPPPTLPDIDPALTSNVLSASLLGPMFSTGPEADIRSDTDTSLYDYENARPTYSSVEFRGTSTADSNRLRAQSPLSHDDYYDEEDGISGRVLPPPYNYSRVGMREPRPRSASPGEPVYAQVRRDRQHVNDEDLRDSVESVPMSASMRRYAEDDQRSLRMSGHSQRSTHHSRRSPSPRSMLRLPSPRTGQAEESRMDTLVVTKIGRGTSPMSTGEFSRKEELAHSASLKLQALEARNLELISQQQEALQQLQQQQRQQSEVMQRLADRSLLVTQQPEESMRDTELGSLLQETQSITEGTLTKQTTLIRSLQARTAVIEQEKEELQELNEQLQAEINSLRRLASIKDTDGEGMGTQVLLLKKQLQDYKDERDTLKSSVHRMNAELSRYQSKYRAPSQAELEEVLGLPVKGPTPSWLINTKYLAPLFLAYDDRLAEKDAIIQEFEEEVESFEQRVEEIVKENQRLHLRLEQSDPGGPVSITEWRQLQEQCRLVLEENQLLMEQLELQQDKTKDLHKAHVQEVSKLSKKLVVAEAERGEFEQQLQELKAKYSDLRKENETVLIEGSVKMGLEDHLSAIAKLKRTLEEEKNKHSAELENLKTKMTTVQADKKGLSVELEDTKSENKQLTAELKALQKAQRKSMRKTLVLQHALQEVETKELSASKYLNTVVKVAEKTAQERDTLAQMAQDRDRQRKKAITKVMQGSVATAKMEEKLKMVKIKATEKLNKAVNRMKEQDNDFNQQRAEYEREIKHLRLLLREREDVLEQLAGEKRCVEDDLETMWQVTTADNRRMRETYRKSVRKLKEHATLDAILSDTEDEKRDLMNLSDK